MRSSTVPDTSPHQTTLFFEQVRQLVHCLPGWLLLLGFPAAAQAPRSSDAFVDYLRFYQRFVSGSNTTGAGCPTYPNCSRFAVLAFQQYAPVRAFGLTTDRLMRCGRDFRYYGIAYQQGNFSPVDFPDPAANAEYLSVRRMPVFARSDSVRDTNADLVFAKKLMNKGFHSQALLVLSRLLYEKPAPRDPELYVNYLACLRAVDEPENALYEVETTLPAELRTHPDVLTEAGQCWMQLKNYGRGAETFGQALRYAPESSEKSDKLTMLRGVALTRAEQWDSARATFQRIPANSFYSPNAQWNLGQLTKLNDVRFKKSGLAGALGVVPGLGYLYTGHRQTALAALLINGLFGWATYSSFERRNYGLGALVGAVSLGFYVGNIQGAARSARRYNQSRRDAVAQAVRLDVDNR
jgi:putative component of membrane protein insertase Oxa1/YidC/SpoIIIJ protein YidD